MRYIEVKDVLFWEMIRLKSLFPKSIRCKEYIDVSNCPTWILLRIHAKLKHRLDRFVRNLAPLPYVELTRPKIASRDVIFFTGTQARSRVCKNGRLLPHAGYFCWPNFVTGHFDLMWIKGICNSHQYIQKLSCNLEIFRTEQGFTLSFQIGCPKSHFLGWYKTFLVYWYLKLDNQVVN